MIEGHYHNDNLFLRTSEAEYSLSSWPSLRAWQRPLWSQKWLRRQNPQLDLQWMLLFAEEPNAAASACRAWLGTIPTSIRSCVTACPAGHWQLLETFRYLGRLAEGLTAGQEFAFLFLLALHGRFVHTRFCWDAVAGLASMPGNDLADMFGFQPSKPAAELLVRVTAGTCSVRNLRLLKAMIRNPRLRTDLAAMPRINSGTIGMLRDPERRTACSPRLLKEVSLSEINDTVAPSVWELDEILDHDKATGHSNRPAISCLAELETTWHTIQGTRNGKEALP
jgi:hypothetical protein